MDTAHSLLMVGIIIIIGILAQHNFKKTRIPDVLFLITAGALISYFDLRNGFNSKSPEIEFLITFSLIYVVFYGALPIKLKALFSTMKYAFVSSVLNFIAITGIIGAIAHFLVGIEWMMSFALGALFCVLDGSIINSILETIKLSPRAEAQIQTESAIIDILVIVGILSILNFADMTSQEIMQNLTNYLFLSLGIGLVASVLWSFALKHVSEYEAAPIANMAALVSIYALAEIVKANGVITVFFFSIMLGNTTSWSKLFYKEQQDSITALESETKHFFREISFLIRTFLFVYLGMLIDFSPENLIFLAAGFLFFTIAYTARSFVRRLINNRDIDRKDSNFIDAMCAKGLTPTVILSLISANPAFTNIVVGGIFSSILMSSILIILIDKDKYTSASEVILNKLRKPKPVTTKEDLKIIAEKV